MALQYLGWAVLVLFGVGYNGYVAGHIRRDRGDFMARFVALGCFVIVAVQSAVTGKWVDGALMLLAFACGGAGMFVGSWQRRKDVGAPEM